MNYRDVLEVAFEEGYRYFSRNGKIHTISDRLEQFNALYDTTGNITASVSYTLINNLIMRREGQNVREYAQVYKEFPGENAE